MITIKLKVHLDSVGKKTIRSFCQRYSYMFRKLYANFELSQDKEFIKQLREKHQLVSHISDSCVTEVQMKVAQEATFRENKQKRIKEIEKELAGSEFVGNKGKRRKFKLTEKLAYLNRVLNKPVTFGSLALLKRVSHLSNFAQDEAIQPELKAVKAEYKSKRILPVFSVGRANQKGNNIFDFDFVGKTILFKPDRNTKVSVTYTCGRSQARMLERLQPLLDDKQIPITTRIDENFIYLSFDEERVSGYHFDEIAYKKEVATIDKEDKQARKDCYKKYAKEREARQLVGKLQNRYMAVDLNPQYIGLSIVDKQEDGSVKVIHKLCYDLSRLSKKLGKASSDKKTKYQRNKRVYEIRQVWKHIFDMATHFKVAHFVCEELEFKQEGKNDSAKEFNRKTKNVWHREETTKLITKWCNVLGIQKIEVNPAYSSFIGNMMYDDFDPISASLEIARRGATKYDKGISIFPIVEQKVSDTMYRRVGLDVLIGTAFSWKKFYEAVVEAKFWYRHLDVKNRGLGLLHSEKSKVRLLV